MRGITLMEKEGIFKSSITMVKYGRKLNLLKVKKQCTQGIAILIMVI